jgi:hypothetical protein
MIKKHSRLIFTMALVLLCVQLSAQESRTTSTIYLKVYFKQYQPEIDESFRDNGVHLEELVCKIAKLKEDLTFRVDSVRVVTHISPEGFTNTNGELARGRATSVVDFLAEEALLPYDIFRTDARGVDWDRLTELTEQPSAMPHREEALNILHNTPEWIRRNGVIVDGRKRQLGLLAGGSPWRYMQEYYFAELRNAVIEVFYSFDDEVIDEAIELAIAAAPEIVLEPETEIEILPETELECIPESEPELEFLFEPEPELTFEPEPEFVFIPESELVIEPELEYIPEPELESEFIFIPEPDNIPEPELVIIPEQELEPEFVFIPEPKLELEPESSPDLLHVPERTIASESTTERPTSSKPIIHKPVERNLEFVLKTNLLFDAVLAPNIGAEINLGRGWSLSADWTYAWWDVGRKHYYWRIYGGYLGARKYLKSDRLFTGHHLGVYGQVLTYDIEFGGDGFQSKLSYGIGVEYGYSIEIAPRLNLDMSIGVGYFGGEYMTYEPVDDHYVWRDTRIRQWIGPTRAEVSLVWFIGN